MILAAGYVYQSINMYFKTVLRSHLIISSKGHLITILSVLTYGWDLCKPISFFLGVFWEVWLSFQPVLSYLESILENERATLFDDFETKSMSPKTAKRWLMKNVYEIFVSIISLWEIKKGGKNWRFFLIVHNVTRTACKDMWCYQMIPKVPLFDNSSTSNLGSYLYAWYTSIRRLKII